MSVDMVKQQVANLIEEASNEFDRLCQERHERGAEKYGPLKFLTANTLEEAMEEVLDLGNYARYTYIRLYMLNAQLDEKFGDSGIPTQNIGPMAFTPNMPRVDNT